MNNNSHSGPGFFNGLLWGLILGGSLVFLLGTKKGKRIIKVINEGLNEVSEVAELFEEDEYEGEKPKQKMVKTEVKSSINEETEQEEQEAPQAKKFFKGIPKK